MRLCLSSMPRVVVKCHSGRAYRSLVEEIRVVSVVRSKAAAAHLTRLFAAPLNDYKYALFYSFTAPELGSMAFSFGERSCQDLAILLWVVTIIQGG